MLSYKDDAFLINNQEQFIFGGELHYFRVPKSQWKDRINKIKEAGFNLVSTYIPWIYHEAKEGEIDLIGKTVAEKDLKTFIEYVEEAGMYLLVRPGPYVMAEIENAGLPFWLLENYSEIRSLKANGEFHPVYELVSYLHPVFLEKVNNWYKEVFAILSPHQISKGGCIVSAQLDNEVGMFHWVTNTPDYSPNVLSYFYKYLRDNNKEQEIVKDSGSSLEEIIAKYLDNKCDESTSFFINNEYKLFFRFYIKWYLEKLKEMGENFGMNVPIVVNVHGFSGGGYAKSGEKYPIGLSQLYEASKIDNALLAGDYYVGNIVYENFHHVTLANAFTKSIQQKDQPLFSAEFQGGFQIGVPRLQPSTYDLKTRLTIANGMNAINYYMFVGGENYDNIGIISKRHDWQAPVGTNGNTRRSYSVLKNIVDVVNCYGSDLLFAKPKTSTTIAFNPDYYMTEYNNEYTQAQKWHIESIREYFIYDGIGKTLSLLNINYDGLDVNSIEDIDVNKHTSLFMPSTNYMSERIQKQLVKYIKDGGNLFLYPNVPTKNMLNEDCTILKDYIDVEILKNDIGGCINLLEHISINARGSQVYSVKNAETISVFEKDETAVTGFIKKIEKGQVCVLGSRFMNEWDYISNAFTSLFDKLEIKPTVEAKATIDSEDWISVIAREKGETGFLFLNNYEDFDKKTLIKYNGVDFDYKAVTIPQRAGLILPVNWSVSADLKIVYSMAEVKGKKVTKDTIELVFNVKTQGDCVKCEGMKPVENDLYAIQNNTIIFKGVGEIKVCFSK